MKYISNRFLHPPGLHKLCDVCVLCVLQKAGVFFGGVCENTGGQQKKKKV